LPLSAAICAKSFSAFSISCFAFLLLGLLSLLLFGDEQERRIDNSKKMVDSFFIMQLFKFFSNIQLQLDVCWCALKCLFFRLLRPACNISIHGNAPVQVSQ